MAIKIITGPTKLHACLLGPLWVLLLLKLERNLERDIIDNKDELKTKLKEILREKSDVFNSKQPEEDKIRLGVPGWKERYYEQKFSAKSVKELEEIRRDVVLRYTEGLCWVMRYYYEGAVLGSGFILPIMLHLLMILRILDN